MPPKAIPTLPKPFHEYGVCIVFTVMLPMVPIFLEWWQKGAVGPQSLTLATAIFSVSIGSSSTSKLTFALTVVVSLVFGIVFGMVIGSAEPPSGCSKAALVSVVAVSVIHLAERWNRHVVYEEAFWKV